MNTLANQFKQQLERNGKPCKVNNIDFTGFFIEIIDNEYVDTKYFFTDRELKQGNIIEVLNCKWIIIQEPINFNDVYSKYMVRKITHSIKFNFNGAVKIFGACVDSKIFDISTGQYFSLVNGNIQVIIQSNIDANNIKLQQRFIKWGTAWEVHGIDKTKEGLIFINAKTTATNSNDDLESEIPDRWQYETKHLYTIETTNIDTTLEQNKTLQFSVTVKDNNVVVENPSLSYSSNNTNCTVNATGLITTIAVGTSIITATFTSAEGITKSVSITITVTEPVQTDNFTYTLTGDTSPDTSISAGYSKTYTAKKLNNGVEVAGQFDFEVIAGTTPLSAYKFTVLNDTQCKIESIEYVYNITLRATDRTDNTQYIDKPIKLKSIF